MKKSVLVIALAFGVSSAFAQDLTSKKGEPILPEAEDWAISFDATPVFQFVGNAFNGNTGNTAPSVNFLNSNQTIIGKKFIDEKSAYRVLVRLGFTNQSFKNLVADITEVTAPTWPTQSAQVTDKFSYKNTNIGIGVGKEMRRGKTRLQGYYGADVMIWIAMTGKKYTYGNVITPIPVAGQSSAPEGTTWQNDPTLGGFGNATTNASLGSRLTKEKSGMTFGIGVRGFIGAEYFIFPKISIGAEYGWGIGYEMKGKGISTTETTQLVAGTNTLGEVETVTAGSSKFGFDTDINQSNMFNFHGPNSGTTGSVLGATTLRATFHF